MDTVHYLLVPDRAAARKVRRTVAEHGARLGVVVGTPPELVELARESYLLPDIADDWLESVREHAARQTSAFWADSFSAAPEETVREVAATLATLVDSEGPAPARVPKLTGTSTRLKERVLDLRELHQQMGARIPAGLTTVRSLLEARSTDAVRAIRVYWNGSLPNLSPWHMALVTMLNTDAPAGEDPELSRLLSASLIIEPAAPPETALGTVQRHLFEEGRKLADKDVTVEWIAARDPLEEAELVACMLQTALAKDASLTCSDFALLLPNGHEYPAVIEEVFPKAGIPISALNRVTRKRDLGKEVVHDFLQYCQEPRPSMAAAAVVASPLMPWETEFGIDLAEAVCGSSWALKGRTEYGEETNRLLKRIRTGAGTPAELRKTLPVFVKSLGTSALARKLGSHLQSAQACMGAVLAVLEGCDVIPWAEALAVSAPGVIEEEKDDSVTREGVAVFRESREPWRQVKHLFVLGFADGNYPESGHRSTIFNQAEQIALHEAGIAWQTPLEDMARKRARFVRQLSSASQSAMFTLSLAGGEAEGTAISQSAGFMAQLLYESVDLAKLVRILERTKDCEDLAWVPDVKPVSPETPREPDFGDLQFKDDLLFLGSREDGERRHESPSSLETMMVSPFAWFLQRAGLTPGGWGVQNLDFMLKGTLAHAVFETVFQADQEPPKATELAQLVSKQFKVALWENAPFLLVPEFRIERHNLKGEILKAAHTWLEIMNALDAKIITTEVSLYGKDGKLPLRGKADAIMELPDGNLIVVDYKKSASKGRRGRMELGYDHQAELYRLMLKTGGMAEEDKAKVAKLKSAARIGIMYFTMNDGVALADGTLAASLTAAGADVLGNDVSARAMLMIREVVDAVSKGVVRLNRDGDEAVLKDKGLYLSNATDTSPLIGLFMIPEAPIEEVTT